MEMPVVYNINLAVVHWRHMFVETMASLISFANALGPGITVLCVSWEADGKEHMGRVITTSSDASCPLAGLAAMLHRYRARNEWTQVYYASNTVRRRYIILCTAFFTHWRNIRFPFK